MTSITHTDLSVLHPGIARAERTVQFPSPVLNTLSVLGAPLVRAFDAWLARRREARADQQYWNAALSDARIMADISRAMSAQTDEQSCWTRG